MILRKVTCKYVALRIASLVLQYLFAEYGNNPKFKKQVRNCPRLPYTECFLCLNIKKVLTVTLQK